MSEKKEDTWHKDIPKTPSNNQEPLNIFPLKKVQEGYDFLKKSHYTKSSDNQKNQLTD